MAPGTGSSMRILWIAYIFPPVGGTQGVRMRRYLEEIVKADPRATIDVLTIRSDPAVPQRDEALAEGLPGSVRVHRVRAGVLHRLRYRCRLDTLVLTRPAGLVHTTLASLIRLSNLAWLPRAAALLWKKRRGYDAVYVFVDPFASVVLALMARWLKPGARIVLDYGDPQIPCRRGLPPLLAAASRLEERALLACSAAVFRTPAVVGLYHTRYPAVPLDRYHVLYGGVDWDAYDTAPPSPGGHQFEIVYTGTIYADSVDPSPFLHAVARVSRGRGPRVKVLMVGAENPMAVRLTRKLGLGQTVSFLGHVPIARLAPLQRSAALLLAFGVRNPYKVSSKLAEYMASRVPILYLAESLAEPGAELVASSRRGMVVLNDADAIAHAIQHARMLWERGELPGRFDLSHSGEFSWSQGAGKIMSWLKSPAGELAG